MGKEFIMFCNIEKQKFHNCKNLILIHDVDINKTIVSSKVPLGKKGFKYFIEYEDNEKVVPFCTILPKMIGYRKNVDETR